MPRKKKSNIPCPPEEDYRIAMWYIRKYDLCQKNILAFEESYKGFDFESKVIKDYKTADDIDGYTINKKIVECVDYALEQYVFPMWQDKVWEYALGKKRQKDFSEDEIQTIKEQYRSLLLGFIKEYGLWSARREEDL